MDASTFPISFTYHLIFSLVAGIFFLLQFFRLRRPYQLLMAIGILGSLLIYVGDEHNQAWFQAVGAFECVILLGCIVLSILFRRKDSSPGEDGGGTEPEPEPEPTSGGDASL